MWPSVESAWPALAREHEGVFRYPYLDHTGKVTVGVGLLIEADNQPTEECFRLPWTVDNQPATRAQIASGWAAVNARNDLAGRAREFAAISHLRLDDQTIDAALIAKTKEFWSELRSQLVNLQEWPADAQLGLIDLAYQVGPHFMELRNVDGSYKWPSFRSGAHSSDFSKCADHCSVKQASATRNARRRRLFLNAVLVEYLGIDPARLWDAETPEEDDMPTDAQLRQIAEMVADLVIPEVTAAVTARLKAQKIPTTKEITQAVLNSSLSDVVPVKDGRGQLWLKNAIGEIHTATTGR